MKRILAWLLQLNRPVPQRSDAELAAEVEHNFNWNFTVNLLDGASFFFGASFASSSTILPLFVSKITTDPLPLGLLAMIAQGAWFLPQLFTANYVERLARKKPVVVNLGLFSERLPMWIIVLAAALAGRWPGLALALFLVSYAWHGLGAGIVATSWQDLIARCFPVNRRGRFFGLTMFLGAGTGAAGGLFSTWLLNTYPFPTNFVYTFAIAATAISISWVWLALAREPVQPVTAPRQSNRAFLAGLPDLLRRDLNFRRFLVARLLMALGGMGSGFVTVAAIQRWHVPDSTAGLYTVALLAGQTAANLVFGFLADRRGHKLSLELGTVAGVLGFLIAWLAPERGVVLRGLRPLRDRLGRDHRVGHPGGDGVLRAGAAAHLRGDRQHGRGAGGGDGAAAGRGDRGVELRPALRAQRRGEPACPGADALVGARAAPEVSTARQASYWACSNTMLMNRQAAGRASSAPPGVASNGSLASSAAPLATMSSLRSIACREASVSSTVCWCWPIRSALKPGRQVVRRSPVHVTVVWACRSPSTRVSTQAKWATNRLRASRYSRNLPIAWGHCAARPGPKAAATGGRSNSSNNPSNSASAWLRGPRRERQAGAAAGLAGLGVAGKLTPGLLQRGGGCLQVQPGRGQGFGRSGRVGREVRLPEGGLAGRFRGRAEGRGAGDAAGVAVMRHAPASSGIASTGGAFERVKRGMMFTASVYPAAPSQPRRPP